MWNYLENHENGSRFILFKLYPFFFLLLDIYNTSTSLATMRPLYLFYVIIAWLMQLYFFFNFSHNLFYQISLTSPPYRLSFALSVPEQCFIIYLNSRVHICNNNIFVNDIIRDLYLSDSGRRRRRRRHSNQFQFSIIELLNIRLCVCVDEIPYHHEFVHAPLHVINF